MHENLRINVNEKVLSFTFYAIFHELLWWAIKATNMLQSEVQISFQFNWVFTPLDFYELLFSKNNCLKIFFLPHSDF